MILKTFLLTLLTTSSTFCFDKKQIKIFITRKGGYEARLGDRVILQYKPDTFLTFCTIPEIGFDENSAEAVVQEIDIAIKRKR